jgi:hypothetical protein
MGEQVCPQPISMQRKSSSELFESSGVEWQAWQAFGTCPHTVATLPIWSGPSAIYAMQTHEKPTFLRTVAGFIYGTEIAHQYGSDNQLLSWQALDEDYAGLGGRMDRLIVRRNHRHHRGGRHALIALWALLFWLGPGAFAQSTAPAANARSPFSTRATHLLGLENNKSNCDGILLIQGNELQFQRDGRPSAEVDISSIRNIFLDNEDRQVGGLPMTLGKAAAPYGTGRVISAIAHKNFDILTLEYVDVDGGVHGALFQLSKGQGDLVRNELVARGVSSSSLQNQSTNQGTSEVTNEND